MWKKSVSVVFKLKLVAAVLGALVLVLTASYGVVAQPSAPGDLPPQKSSAVRGKSIYEARCVRCHGLQGAGDGEMVAQLPAPPPSFLDQERMQSVVPADYFDTITNGNVQALMPPWGQELSVQERWDVLFYVWSLGVSRDTWESGGKVYNQQCVDCHGEAGGKVEAINLGDLTRMATLSQADLVAGIREGHSDVEWTDTLADDARWAVAMYVRAFTYDTVFAAAEAAGEGVIAGRIVGGTAGVEPDFSAVELSLFPFVGQTALAPITTTTEADGGFVFEGLATDVDRSYGLQATYLGVDYFYPSAISLVEQPATEITLPVYETTTDGSAITVDRNHVIINFANNQLQVAELYIFRNAGDRTFVGDPETLRFSLPKGARNLSFEDPRMNQSTRFVDGQVVDTLPVSPGTRQVLVSYNVPYEGRSLDFEKPIDYVTQSLNVFIADVGVAVNAGSMVVGEPIAAQSNLRFSNYSRENVAVGEKLSLKLSNLPEAGATGSASVPADRSGTLRWLGLGFVILAVAFVLAYPALRPRLVTEGLLEDVATVSMLRRRRQLLLEDIASLDDSYAIGDVAESQYAEMRAKLKADLIDVMQRLQAAESSES